MLNCKYCKSVLESGASFCGSCGNATSVIIDDHTYYSDAVSPVLSRPGEDSTFITPLKSVQGQVFSSKPHNYVSNEKYSLQERTEPVHFTQKSWPAANVSTADRPLQQAHVVRLQQPFTPVNYQAPTVPASIAPPPQKRRKGNTGRIIAISALLFAIALVTPLFYVAATHASFNTTSGLKNCSTTSSNAKLSLGPVVEGQSQLVSMPFTLCSQGTETVNWTSSWDQQQASWFQIDHTSGQITAVQTQQVSVSADARNLKAGSYNATITFSAQNNTSIMLDVILVVQRAAPNPPCINIYPDTLTFTTTAGQKNPSAQKVSVKNCGKDTGQWSVATSTSDGASWLKIDSNTGALNSGSAQDVNATIDNTNLKAGSYTGQVIFTLGTQQKTLNVTLTVHAAAIPLAPCLRGTTALTFTAVEQQSNPPTQSVQLKNPCGPGNWKATSSDPSWLNVTPASGQLNGNDVLSVNVAVNSNGLSANTYNGTITFSAGTKTVTVNVTLTVQPLPSCIKNLSASALIFNVTQGSSAVPQQVTFSNPCGSGKWSAALSDQSRLSITPGSGTLSGGDTVKVNIAVDASNLSPGAYTGTVTFNDGTNTLTVNVTLNVKSPSQSTPTPYPS